MKRLARAGALLATGGVILGGGYIYYSIVKQNKNVIDRDTTFRFDHLNRRIPNRMEQLQKINHYGKGEAPEFDVLVIGGGATGCGVALDATTRGLNVCLLEKNDFASGTSSRSTKMAHGGVRYLQRAVQNFDLSELHFVYDSLRERQHFFNVAPHLVNALPIMAPCYTYLDVITMYTGLKLYDIMSKTGFTAPKSVDGYKFDNIADNSVKWISRKDMEPYCPTLKRNGLKGSVLYFDGCFNDARIALSTALTAASMGACVMNHFNVVQLLKDPETKKCTGVLAVDELTGKQYKIRAKSVVNATGYLSDTILKMDADSEGEIRKGIMRPSSGVHLALDNSLIPKKVGLLFPKTKDGRVMFVIPWEGRTIVGTTDTPVSLQDLIDKPPKPTEEDIAYILEHLSDSFEIPIRRDQVLSAWAGIRPLVDPGAMKKSEVPSAGTSVTAVLPRDHFIHASKSNLITICGGKWTTYRRMAEETVDKAIETVFLKPRYPASKAISTPLIGAAFKFDENQVFQKVDNNTQLANHLLHCYGSKALDVVEYGKKKLGKNWNRKLSDKFDFIEAEVLHHVNSEYACHASDIIGFRTNLMLLDRNEAKKIVPKVVELMGSELAWDHRRRKKEVNDCYSYIDQCTL